MDQTNFNNGMTYRQLQLSNTMRRIWIEHVLWTRFFIVSTAFDSPDIQFVTERLLQNPEDMARELKPLYGENVAMQISSLFTDHLSIAAELVNAAKEGNSTEVDRQRSLWYANAEDIARFLASINPFWSQREWRDLLFDHLRMTEDEAGATLTGQYENSIIGYDQIQAQAFNMADVMTRGIIQQFRII
jgi:hypothetical protein